MVRCCLLATSLRFDQGYTDICVVASAPPRKLDPVRSLANVAIFTLVRRLLVRGHPGSCFFWTASQTQRGCCRHPRCIFGTKSPPDAEHHRAGRAGYGLALGHLSEFTDGVRGRWSAENALWPRCGGGCCPGTPPSFYQHEPDTVGRGRKIGAGLPSCTVHLVEALRRLAARPPRPVTSGSAIQPSTQTPRLRPRTKDLRKKGLPVRLLHGLCAD